MSYAKSCPFCGGRAVESVAIPDHFGCDTDGCPCDGGLWAVDIWNKRRTATTVSEATQRELEAYYVLSGARTAMEYALWIEEQKKQMPLPVLRNLANTYFEELNKAAGESPSEFQPSHFFFSGLAAGLFVRVFGFIFENEKEKPE